MNMAKYGSRKSQQNINFEPIIRGLKGDMFDRDQSVKSVSLIGEISQGVQSQGFDVIFLVFLRPI